MAVPLSQLIGVGVDESTADAMADWHYWAGQGTVSDSATYLHQDNRPYAGSPKPHEIINAGQAAHTLPGLLEFGWAVHALG
jgi:hypothetical protein